MTISSSLLILMVIIALIGCWGMSRFNIELKKSHPAVFDDLYSPNKSWGKSFLQELRESKFILLRSYKSLNNRRLSMFGDIVFLCSLIHCCPVN
jgi:hypothetical protein